MEKICHQRFLGADIVITDRLHSMVFALLAGCKCIAIDNTTHKVSGVYKKWLYTINGLWVLENSSKLSDDILSGRGNLPGHCPSAYADRCGTAAVVNFFLHSSVRSCISRTGEFPGSGV